MSMLSGFVGDVAPFKVRMACAHIETRMLTPSTAGAELPAGRLDFDPAAAWQLESEADCADCQKIKADARAAQAPPVAGALHTFYPEMYERPADRLFLSRMVGGDAYHIEWSPARDAEARALFKKLRIRPKSRGPGKEPIELWEPGQNYLGKAPIWTCMVTGAAIDKLKAYTSHQVLLD